MRRSLLSVSHSGGFEESEIDDSRMAQGPATMVVAQELPISARGFFPGSSSQSVVSHARLFVELDFTA